MISLAAAPNFRTLGPLPAADGRMLPAGRLYRSGDLSDLSPAEQRTLRGAALKLVVDLRSPDERGKRPNRLADDAGPAALHGDLQIDIRAGHGGLRGILAGDPSPAGARSMMMATYRGLPVAMTPLLPRLAERLIGGEIPALLLCTAGKDRTGFLCASLLRLLGIPMDAIVEDYLHSNRLIDMDRMAAITGDLVRRLFEIRLERATLDVINAVDADYLMAGFDAIDREFGSFDAWLAAAGIDQARIAALRSRLLA